MRVPLRQTEGAHQRYYERPFAFVVIPRPVAHVRECDLQRWAIRVSSRSDLMTLPFILRQSHVFRSNPVVDHPHRMHDHPNMACSWKTSTRCSCALLISPMSCISRTSSFMGNSSCCRICSFLHSTSMHCTSCTANLRSSVCRYCSPLLIFQGS